MGKGREILWKGIFKSTCLLLEGIYESYERRHFWDAGSQSLDEEMEMGPVEVAREGRLVSLPTNGNEKHYSEGISSLNFHCLGAKYHSFSSNESSINLCIAVRYQPFDLEPGRLKTLLRVKLSCT